MSAPATHLQPARKPVLPDSVTPDTLFWRKLTAPLLIKENNAVNHIHFSPANPHDMAFTSSTKIQILSSKTQQVYKTIAKFKDTVYSGEFRPDGRLLVAGDATGLIQCFDTSTKAVLVTLKPSSHAVHVTKFHPTSMSTLLSASDDRVVRLWDLTSSDPLVEIKDQHKDYIRSASFVGNLNLIATGCYDGYIRLFDPRSPSVVAEYFQRDPVESVLPLNDSMLASSGGPSVKIWDLTAGKKMKQLGNFQKTVTCLAAAEGKGILAGSLDGHVKVFDSNDPSFPVKFGWKYGGPVLSTAISPDLRQMATGLTTGLLSVRTRKSPPENKPKESVSQSEDPISRYKNYRGEFETQSLRMTHKPKAASRLKLYEKHIKAFRWGDALDAAFGPNVTVDQTIMVLEELRMRGKVAVSLSDHDESSLEPILEWCVNHISDPRTVDITADWVSVLADMYATLLESSPVLAALFDTFTTKLNEQIDRARDSQELEGMLEFLMA